MSSCQTFKDTIGKIETSQLSKLWEAYVSSLSESSEKALSEALNPLKTQKDEFVREYQEKTRELFKSWCDPKIISFEDETQRVIIKAGNNLEIRHDFFPSLIKGVEGDLNFPESFMIEHVDHLEFVKGSLWATSKKTRSFASLRHVEGSLAVLGSNLTNLDSLTYVGGHFNAEKSKLSSLLRLISVGGNFSLQGTDITHLENLETVGGEFYVAGTKIEDMLSLESVGGQLFARNCNNLKSMPKLKRVGKALTIDNCPIRALDALEKVQGDFAAEDCPLTSMASLTEIGGCLYLPQNKEMDLPNFRTRFPRLKKIGKDTAGVSASVSSRELVEEIKILKKNGVLAFDGKVTVWPLSD